MRIKCFEPRQASKMKDSRDLKQVYTLPTNLAVH